MVEINRKFLLINVLMMSTFVLRSSAASKSVSSSSSPSSLSNTRYLLKKPKCNVKNQMKIERLVARAAVIGPHGRRLPESMQQLKSFCRETNTMVAKMEAFVRDCYTKEIQDWSNLVMYTVKYNIRKYCGRRGVKIVQDLIKLAPCANKYVQTNETCIRVFIDNTAQLVPLTDDSKKIPHLCCNFVENLKCAEDMLDHIPCMRAHTSQLMDLFRNGIQGVFDFGCGEFNGESEACDKLGPAPKPTVPNKTKYLSFPFLMIDVLSSIKDYEAPGQLG